MLAALARFVVRRRKAVLVAALLAMVVAGAVGGGVAKHLSGGGFDDPGAESSQARRTLAAAFGQRSPNLVLLVTATAGSVDDPQAAAAGVALTKELAAQTGVTQATSYWTLGSPPPLRSADGRQALVLATIGGSDDHVADVIKQVSPRFTRTGDGSAISVQVGGYAEVFRQVSTQIEHDLKRAETLSLPIVLVLLVVVFGSVVAASLPLGIGALAVIGTFLVLRVLASFTQVSIFALNLTTAMGLGLAIDYSLFVVSRYREELRHGASPDEAMVRTVTTAGRTVIFSAVTVAVSLAAMLVFPLAFLRSFAYAGVAVVALAAVGAVVVLPALLAVLGARVDKLVLWRRAAKPEGTGFWHRVALAVMRRPVPVATVIIVVLLFLGAPFLRIAFGLPDDRVLPASASSHQVQDAIRTNFSSNEAGALSVVARTADAANTADIARYAADLSRAPGAARVDASTGSYIGGQLVAPPNEASARFTSRTGAGTWLSVVPAVEPYSAAGEKLVKAVRAVPPPFAVQVGGQSAELVDSKASLFGRVPLAGGLIALVTFVALFLMTGGVLVPVKAVVVNLLSLTASFGAMVWIFQEGHLSGILDFTATGTIATTMPILMFCIAFGLSMDYEVFLLSRIKEEYDRTGDNVGSVALGLERTGRIVTAAAALLAVVFLAFATSHVTFIKLFGLGLALAVILDATLIRAALVPAFMRLAGRANWWAPPALRRVHARFGISDADRAPVAADPPRREKVRT
ncbi:MAG TPA: MMPL family transporter [Acidimicrobiales bacterium]|jgi:RND superfamily putative drug exporter|nr:MMPL family transporter [Acidimicrobiales bacterium]